MNDGGDRLVPHRVTRFEVIDEDGDLAVTGTQVCEVRVGVRVFVSGSTLSVSH